MPTFSGWGPPQGIFEIQPNRVMISLGAFTWFHSQVAKEAEACAHVQAFVLPFQVCPQQGG